MPAGLGMIPSVLQCPDTVSWYVASTWNPKLLMPPRKWTVCSPLLSRASRTQYPSETPDWGVPGWQDAGIAEKRLRRRHRGRSDQLQKPVRTAITITLHWFALVFMGPLHLWAAAVDVGRASPP